MKDEKLSKGLSGIAGEYFVAAELSRRGFMASITLRNNDSIDIHASKIIDGINKIFAIQVKSNQTPRAKWLFNQKAESLKAQNLFYVFVHLKSENERPDYYIINSMELSKTVSEGHAH